MTRSSFRPMVSVGLVAAVLTYVGCAKGPDSVERPVATRPGPLKRFESPIPPKLVSAETPTPPQVTAGGKKVELAQKEPGSKVIADWSARPPAAVLVISGEQDGYPDPCGCTDGQLGGLGRRYDLIEKLEAKRWPLVKVDLGNLIQYRGTSRGGPEQEKIKFGIIHKALGAMRYDAVALGPEDLKQGVVETLGALLNFKEPKFLAANVSAVDKVFDDAIRPIKFVEVGSLPIGITAVLDPAAYRTIQDADAAMLTVKPPDDVLADVLVELRRRAKVTVLMVQGPHEEAKRLAEKFDGFDIVIGTSETSDPDERPEKLNGGRTLLIRNVGKKGKHVGLVGFFPQAAERMVYRRQSLDAKDFRQAEPMRLLVDKEYQEMLKAQGVVENFVRAGTAQAGATYLGAQACQACHPKAFEKWSSTKHARAYEALTSTRRNREFDAECISCHTTGFGYVGGWVSAEKTPNLKGNQCENCHGPGSLHAAQPANPAFSKPMAMSAESAKSNAFCTKCHDEDNGPHFKFDTFYPQIYHKGLDDLADPKVRQPRPANVVGQAK